MDTTTKDKLLRLSFRTQILPSSTQPQSSRREIDNHPRKGKKEDIETIERDLEGADMVVEAEEKMVLKDVTLMIMIRRETATTKGGEHMMMITMMMMIITICIFYLLPLFTIVFLLVLPFTTCITFIS